MDIEFVRKQFPALRRDFIFMDNAGGSQVLGNVINNIQEYFTKHNVQLGASYSVSQEAGNSLSEIHRKIGAFLNSDNEKEVVIGPSTTMLLRILSLTISENWQEGDEVIVTNTDHEANVSPWMELEKKGIQVKIWEVNPENLELELSDLEQMLSPKTKLVAVTHASNVLGTINDIQKISEVVHKAGALICVDGVAYAPHRKIDVQQLDVDFYTFSWYKTYGPHLAVMYGKYSELLKLKSLNHYFIGKDEIPYKLQPGNFNFELTYSLGGILRYYEELHDHHFPKSNRTFQEKISAAFDLITDHEEKLAAKLLGFLRTIPEIRIIGNPQAGGILRVPTISFVHSEMKSDEVVRKIDRYQIGIRFGDFYAKKLIKALNLEEKNGVIRVSLVHYNSLEEVDKLIAALKDIV